MGLDESFVASRLADEVDRMTLGGARFRSQGFRRSAPARSYISELERPCVQNGLTLAIDARCSASPPAVASPTKRAPDR